MVDIGGTTSDVGILQHGFPREAAVAVEIGGVRTNFRMPDVLSLGIGGGSHVDGAEVGPQSVGYELTSRALVFGGDVLTATDLAVAAGLAEIGDPERVAGIDAEPALARIEERIAETVDRMKTSADPIPVVVVGGGSILLRDTLPGASELVKPQHFAVANAIGAAIAQVGGEVDKVVALEGTTRAAAIEEAKAEAVEKAVAAGADRDGVRVVDVEDVPIAYLAGDATRIRVKAIGDLDLGRDGRCGWSVRRSSRTSPSARRSSAPAAAATRTSASCSRRRPCAATAPSQMVTVDEVPDDAFVVPSAMMGAPTVMVEKLPRGTEVINAFKALGSYMGREPTHTTSIEAGGLNSTTPFVVAAQLGIPLVDADGMGRAFPEIQMIIATMHGVSATPMTLADEKGNSAVIDTIDNSWTERLARTLTVDFGATAMIALYPMTGKQLKAGAFVAGTIGLAEELGRLVRETRAAHGDPVGAVVERLERAAAVRRQGRRRRAEDGGRLGEGRGADRGKRRGRRLVARAPDPERAPGRDPGRRGRVLGAGPDRRHGRRERRPDHDRGAALRVPRRRDRRAVRAGLAHGGRARARRPALLRLRHRLRPRRGKVPHVTYVELQNLTWPEAERLGAEGAVGLVTLASLEQHGPHLPLATDSLLGERLAREVAERLPGPVRGDAGRARWALDAPPRVRRAR